MRVFDIVSLVIAGLNICLCPVEFYLGNSAIAVVDLLVGVALAAITVCI